MGVLRRIVISIFICVSISQYCSAIVCKHRSFSQIKDDRLQALVDAESVRIFGIAGLRRPVILTNDTVNISVPNKGILLSRHKLNLYSMKYEHKMFIFIVDYLLSHELAHQMQFEKYKNDIISTNSCEKKSLYECQADIIAGILIGKYYNFRDTSTIPANSDFFSRALTFLYDIGNDEYIVSTHPSHLQRRNAIRLGFNYSMIGGNWSNNFTGQTIRSLEYNSSEGELDWSLKTAKRITHYPVSVGKYIDIVSFYNDTTATAWDTSISHPFVAFSRTIKNTSDKPIKVFMQYRLVGKSRADSADRKLIDLQGDFKNFNIVLQPKESYKCIGIINWLSVGNKLSMPSIIFPPDNEALYNAEYVDTNISTDADNNCMQNSFASDAPVQIESYKDAIERINEESIDDFDEFKTGFAEEGSQNVITYKSNYKFPFSESESIDHVYPASVRSVWIMGLDLYRNADKNQAKKVFQAFADILNNYTGLQIDTVKIDSNDSDSKHTSSILPGNIYVEKELGTNPFSTMELSGMFLNTKTTVRLIYTDDSNYPYTTVRLSFKSAKK